MGNLYMAILALFTVTCTLSQPIYTWIGANNGSWATAGNWSPTRNTPAANDILRFNGNNTRTITSVPSQTIGRLQIIGNTHITLNAASDKCDHSKHPVAIICCAGSIYTD